MTILKPFASRRAGLSALILALAFGGAAPPARATAGFTAVDLGTLGGQHSTAQAINDAGQVVGWSHIPAGNTHAFSWTQGGGMVDLGTLGGSNSQALFVGGDGQVVGDSDSADTTSRVFSWTQTGGMVDIGTLGGYTRATAINDGGWVVGLSTTAAGSQHAFAWTRGGGMIDLGALAGSGYSFATAVNNGGQVVGTSATADGVGQHAFSWTPTGGMVDIGTLGGNSSAYGVNASGQVFGVSTVAGEEHAFSWTPAGGMVDLGTLPLLSNFSYFVAVNANGQFVGNNFVSASNAFSWTQTGGSVDLTLGGLTSASTAVNDHGQVVGASDVTGDFERHAFSWTQAGGIVDLGTFGGTVSQANAVNESGQIAGASAGGGAFPATHAALWIPTSAGYAFHGFFQPIDNDGVFNVAKAGQGIPVKFDLSGEQGLAIFAAGYPRSGTIPCSGTAPQDAIEQTVSAGKSGLQFDATVSPPLGEYTYVWKTENGWAGTCRQLQVKLSDGQLHTANFRFAQ
jgi:probable HAF family extracellular repeat protein